LKTEGKNGRLQDGAGALRDQAEPADQAAVGQGHLVGGVALPGGMHLVGATVGGRRPPRAGGGQAGQSEPAADGLHRGEGGAGVVFAQDDADKAGPPARVLLAEGAGLGDQVGRGARPGAVVIGGGAGLAGLAELSQQAAGRAHAEAETRGEGRGAQAAPGGGKERLADGEGDGSWHRWGSAAGEGAPDRVSPEHGAAKPDVPFSGQSTCSPTEPPAVTDTRSRGAGREPLRGLSHLT